MFSTRRRLCRSTHSSCVAEIVVAPQAYLLKHTVYCGTHLAADAELARRSHVEEYLCQLVGSVVVEMYGLGETALQSGVGVDEVVHLLCVASHDADKLATVVFQTLQQCVDSLRSEGVLVV